MVFDQYKAVEMSRKNLFLFDEPAENLRGNVLPTIRETIKAVVYVKNFENVGWKNAIKSTLTSVYNIWTKASLPKISLRRIDGQLTVLINKYKSLQLYDEKRRETSAFKTKSSKFLV